MNRGRQWLLVYLAVAGLFASLFVVHEFPPFMDYPNHLLEAKVVASPERFAPYYYVKLDPIPNLTAQVLLGLAGKIMDIRLAGRLFYVAVILCFGLGAFLFARRHLTGQYWAGLAFFVLLSNFFLWRGYMNFTLSISLVLLAVSLDSKRAGVRDLCFSCLITAVLFFTHFYAPAVFILYRICGEIVERRFRLGTALCAGIFLALAVAYFRAVPGELSWLNFESPYWKLALIKRISGMPYLALISSPVLFAGINIHNALVYLSCAGAVLLIAVKAPKIMRRGGTIAAFLLVLLVLAIVYAVAPATIGLRDVDNRIGFFFLLFALPIAAYLVLRRSRSAAVLRFFIVAMVYQSFMLTYGQFESAQERLAELNALAQEHKGPRVDEIRYNQIFRVQDLAMKSRLFAAMERVKIHTDVTQVALSEEHADSYFYLNGGFPRRLFVTSLVKASPQYRQTKTH